MTPAKHQPSWVGLLLAPVLGLSLLAGAAQAGVSTERAARARPASATPQVSAIVNPATQETRVFAEAGGTCVSLALPQAWALESDAGAPGAVRLSAADGPVLDLNVRSARGLPPVPTLASRDGLLPTDAQDLPRRAAFALQREQEGLMGRPAQSVTLTPLAPGSFRWTATWLDPNLPGGLTLDTVLLTLSPEWVLEVTLTDAEDPDVHEAVMGEVLGRVKVGC